MASVVGSVLRRALRKPGGRLNILTFRHDEAFEASLCDTGHQFWAANLPGDLPWSFQVPLPDNLVFLGSPHLPPDVDFDVMLAPHGCQTAYELAPSMHLPLISIYLTVPAASWSPNRVAHARRSPGPGDYNVFPSAEHRDRWQWPAEVPHLIIANDDVGGWCDLLERAASTTFNWEPR